MPFPRDRFARAGATPDQLATYEAHYEELSPDAQAGYDERIAPLSDYAIAELLAEPAAEVQEAPEAEVVVPDPEVVTPPASSSSSSSSSSSGSSGTK